MAAKLALPFPLLADETAAVASAWGVYDESAKIARAAMYVVGRDLTIPFRYVGHDFADRPPLSELFTALDSVSERERGPLTRAVSAPGPREPRDSGKRPMPFADLAPYFRGAHYAVAAFASRVDDRTVKLEAERYHAMLAEFQKHVAATARLAREQPGEAATTLIDAPVGGTDGTPRAPLDSAERR